MGGLGPGIGGFEILVIGLIALIVVGPKDLPVLMKRVGQFMAKMRGMASEFRASFDEMARQSELDELRKEVEAMRRGQLADTAAADASKAQVDQVFKEIGDSLQGSDVRFPPSASQSYEPPAPEPAAPEPAPIVEEAKPRARRTAKPKAETDAKPKVAKPKAPKPKAAAKSKAGAKA